MGKVVTKKSPKIVEAERQGYKTRMLKMKEDILKSSGTSAATNATVYTCMV